jgi:carotenoid cleavage dioxygenase-like enzyme
MTTSVDTVSADDFVAVDNFAPVDRERDIAALPVKGVLPPGLRGSLYRNGPNPQFAAPHSHWFVGDGMLHAFTLADGKASYRNRYVRTPKWLAEHDAGRALFTGFGQKLPDPPPNMPSDSGVANTNVVWHGGRLLALEEAHLPTEIDPAELATRGRWNGNGRLGGPFTAHPKVDPVTGEMVFFGYNADGPFTPGMTCGTIAADGLVTKVERFAAPYASMVHDFIVTERHLLFPILPLTGSMERARSGRPPYAWEPDKGAYVGVMRRGGAAADMVWFRGEACYVFHVMNAWEAGNRILADVMEMPEPPLFPRPDGSPTDPAKAHARLVRWTFDLGGSTDAFKREPLGELFGEFPRIDDRRAGLAHRHGWYACASAARSDARFNGIAHVDSATGSHRFHFLPAGDVTSEPVFVPRAADSPEGDGWLLAVIWRAREGRSDLAVFDAAEVDAGAVATVQLPCRVPFGFHGNWVAAAA